jgi:hypothetical protein
VRADSAIESLRKELVEKCDLYRRVKDGMKHPGGRNARALGAAMEDVLLVAPIGAVVCGDWKDTI